MSKFPNLIEEQKEDKTTTQFSKFRNNILLD